MHPKKGVQHKFVSEPMLHNTSYNTKLHICNNFVLITGIM